jgi:hypothetical protein
MEQLNGLRATLEYSRPSNTNTHWSIGEALNSIREVLLKSLPSEEQKTFEVLVAPVKFERSAAYPLATEDGLRLCLQLISYARETKQVVPSTMPGAREQVLRVVPNTTNVFIIHGHDQVNVLRLRTLLKERFRLNPIVLSEQASKGRALIEKFEEEATSTTFALVLFTPDDLIHAPGGQYPQARPNVIFELGWFYGRLGRSRVCMLFKEGTSIPSDLDGILRIQFKDSVEEAFVQLQRELEAAGLV